MAKMRVYAKVDAWTVKELLDAITETPSDTKQITIPEFQRRLVWDKNKQEKLITSIKKGFPFGSLLLYEDIASGNQSGESKRFYKLIDGLQRTQALIKYTEEPNTFFHDENISPEFVDTIIQEFKLGGENAVVSTRRAIERWVKSVRGFTETDGWGTNGMVRSLIKDLLTNGSDDSDTFFMLLGRASNNNYLQEKIAEFLRDVREDADISGAEIPIIIYAGSAENLPTVFELLNSQGVALSRYEIFAAQWNHGREIIENEKIIDAIWGKYEALEAEGFTLDVTEQAPDNKARKKRVYSLFEYLFGFGQYLATEYKYLFKSIAPDRPSSAGFNLVSACCGLDVKDMGKLPKKIKDYKRSELEAKILETIKFINEILSPILSIKQKDRTNISIYHSEFQIISMIATAFQARYALRDLSETDDWKNQWSKLKQYIPMYYLYDILRDNWRGSGDAKLHEEIQNKRYLKTPPSQTQWKQVLENWFLDKQITLLHSKRYTRDQTPEILFLKYIYVHNLSVFDNGSNTYHIEHLVPVDRLTSIMGDKDMWPINAVSNLALLEAPENLKKGNKTFVEYILDRKKSGKITESQATSEEEEYVKRLICPPSILPEEINLNNFNNFLFDRLKILIDEFIKVWQNAIPADGEPK